MGRVFILEIILSLFFIYNLFSQNLIKNGNFEDVISSVGDYRMRQDSFYAKNWFTPTDCSVDIYRNREVCNDNYIRAHEPGLDFCVEVASGNYCLGLYLINYFGYMEHITGKLKEPLEAGEQYLVSYSIRYLGGNDARASIGMGFKFSKDSILFKSNIMDIAGLSPFYSDLYGVNKVYADYSLAYRFIDTNWTRIESIFTAEGGEKFLTFGKFCYQDDKKIIGQFNYLRHHPKAVNNKSFLDKEKSLVIKKVRASKVQDTPELLNYYLLDSVKVELIKGSTNKTSKGNFNEYKSIADSCPLCVDLDPLTNLPNRRQIEVDRGFVGKMDIQIVARLRPMEKLVVEYSKNNQIVIVNLKSAEPPNTYSEITYLLKESAKKLKQKPIVYYAERTDKFEIQDFERKYHKKIYNHGSFEGIIFYKYK
ncbi:MAG TPA: hypothetical protein PKC76_13850 [Saprospiraceae bacterium]|nr:hypothetical protein [Saprospiraceae bacterium]HMP25219.1 hypothetical protein [Saprospiraceae bacterium]